MTTTTATFSQQAFEEKLIGTLGTSAAKAVKGWRHREVNMIQTKAFNALGKVGYDSHTAQAIVNNCWDMALLRAEVGG